MADVFISYSKQDADKARLLSAFLEAQGYSVWWDQNLTSGERFRHVIMRELAQAKAVVVIWTTNSITSDWVLSEAGRAHAEAKLIPLKDGSVSYQDVPPPFDNMHIEDVAGLDHIEAAIVAQMAKPPAAPPVWKVARYQLFSWFGIVGAAITLFTNLSSFLSLADWAHWLASNWIELAERFWGTLLGWVNLQIPSVLVHDLNIMVFVVMTAIGSKLAFSTQMWDPSAPIFDIRMLLRWNVLVAGPAYVMMRYIMATIMFENFWSIDLGEPTIDFFYFYWMTNLLPVLVFIFLLVFHWPLRSNLETVASMGFIVTIYLFGLMNRPVDAISQDVFLIENIIVSLGGILGVMFASPTHYPARLWTIIGFLFLLAVGNEISKLDLLAFAPLN